jgi:hypothetical protein
MSALLVVQRRLRTRHSSARRMPMSGTQQSGSMYVQHGCNMTGDYLVESMLRGGL